MRNEGKSRFRFFPRFSLLTAVVLLVTAAALIWLNLRPRSLVDENMPHGFYRVYYSVPVYGWPKDIFDRDPNFSGAGIVWINALTDLGAGLGILAMTGVISEAVAVALTRTRRSRKNPI